MVLYLDAEQAASLPYMQRFGIDTNPDKFMFAQTESAEMTLQVMREMIDTGAFSLVVLDSIASMATEAQLGKASDEKTMGSLAGVLSPELTKIKTSLAKTNTACILINQTRQNISSYGGGETTPGGNAPSFYASLRLRVSKVDLITEGKDIIGQELKIDFKKNKIGTPFKVVTTKLLFGKGFDFEYEYVSIAESKGIITRGGAWYSWIGKNGTELKFQGAVKTAEFFKNNIEEFEYIKELCQKDVEVTPVVSSSLDEEEDSYD